MRMAWIESRRCGFEFSLIPEGREDRGIFNFLDEEKGGGGRRDIPEGLGLVRFRCMYVYNPSEEM